MPKSRCSLALVNVERAIGARTPMVERLGTGIEAGLDIPQVDASRELRVGHAQKLVPAPERAHALVALIATHPFVEFVAWNEFHDLRKDGLGDVHLRHCLSSY